MSREFPTQRHCQGGFGVICHRAACNRRTSGVASFHRSAYIRRVFGVARSRVGEVGNIFRGAASSGISERTVASWWSSLRPAACLGPRSIRPHPGIGHCVGARLEPDCNSQPISPPNKRVKYARFARPTGKSDALLPAAYAQRYKQ